MFQQEILLFPAKYLSKEADRLSYNKYGAIYYIILLNIKKHFADKIRFSLRKKLCKHKILTPKELYTNIATKN